MRTNDVVGSQCATAIIGRSPATVRLCSEIRRVAPYASNVLITGPSGTGKELVARQIHALSPRAKRPFIPVDCASITGELMSSQLFGHVTGAFTGANCDALGCFRAANGGTLFLDEIGELEFALQAKLLRVLQERVVTPVGSHSGEPVDVRMIAATNRDLRAEVRAGRFRDDLYYRLHVVHLRTTALRERLDDVPVLAEAVLKQLSDEGLPACLLSAEALEVLLGFDWPGNVRQLRNVLEQAVIDSRSAVISAETLQPILRLSLDAPGALANCRGQAGSMHTDTSPAVTGEALPSQGGPPALAEESDGSSCRWPSLEEIERQHISETLEHTFYNRSAAARLLGISRQALLRKMKRHGLHPPDRGRP